MKKILSLMIAAVISLSSTTQAFSGELDILVGKLVDKGVLTPAEAQIVLDETRVQVSKDLAQAKSYAVPDWTQKMKMGGDLRVRTQGDWGKSAGTANLPNQRIRNRIRGRFYLEGKVNDFTYLGTRFAGGGTNPRSTNDTMDGTWSKDTVMFDQYYVRFEAPRELVRDYGQYFSDLKFWAGKFNIPYQYSELVWDSDINPTGVALQYATPDIETGVLPDFNIYSNLGMFWLEESNLYNTDPLLFGYQVGAVTEPFGPLATTLNIATTYYDFANLQGKTPTVSAATNSRIWSGDDFAFLSTGSPLIGSYKYEYQVFDLLVNVDNAKIMDIDFPHGFYGDMISNLALGENLERFGYLLGGYIGKKKIKEPGDWKTRAEWRYIERDAIPDFMPDSDFYGFGTYTAATTRPNVNGLPAEGGTNGKGANLAFEYQLLKNTSLNLEYYWMKPIKSWDKHNPWHELQIDVITKF